MNTTSSHQTSSSQPSSSSSSNASECQCCFEPFSKTAWCIACPYPTCKFSVCNTCIQTYIIDKKLVLPSCMSCNQSWTDSFIRSNCASSWVEKQYKQHVKHVLLEQQKSFASASMQKVSFYSDKDKFLSLATRMIDLLEYLEYGRTCSKLLILRNSALPKRSTYQTKSSLENDLFTSQSSRSLLQDRFQEYQDIVPFSLFESVRTNSKHFASIDKNTTKAAKFVHEAIKYIHELLRTFEHKVNLHTSFANTEQAWSKFTTIIKDAYVSPAVARDILNQFISSGTTSTFSWNFTTIESVFMLDTNNQFIRRCFQDRCQGYICPTSSKCIVCRTKVCLKCCSIVDDQIWVKWFMIRV